ncbi:MAG: metallophosphoesterase [Clostridiales Family XIII bacterium]|jgi:hypothetical protein|nr:metallophosphoesterase [Clostridiales Family XIII bacterium]
MRKFLLLIFISTCFVSCGSCEKKLDPEPKEDYPSRPIQKSEVPPDNNIPKPEVPKPEVPKVPTDNVPPAKVSTSTFPEYPFEYTCSADQENIFLTIGRFEYLYALHQGDIDKQIQIVNEIDRIYGLSDSEGKYWNLYSWLRLSGLIKKFDPANPGWIYFNLISHSFSETPSGEYSKDENDKNFLLSKNGKFIRFPKFEVNPDYKSTCIHLGDILDRGRHATICLLTVLYLKELLVTQGKGDLLILIIGNHELQNYVEENRFDVLFGDGKQSVRNIVLHAIKKNWMQFFGMIQIGSKRVLLTHREISKDTVNCPSFRAMFPGIDVDTGAKFLTKIGELNDCFKNSDDLKKLSSWGDCDRWEHVYLKDLTNIFISQLCGHIHHSEDVKVKCDLTDRFGYFFMDPKGDCVIYFDNYSTTSTSSGHYGLSTANVLFFDRIKNPDMKDAVVFKLVDRKEDNFQIYKGSQEL